MQRRQFLGAAATLSGLPQGGGGGSGTTGPAPPSADASGDDSALCVATHIHRSDEGATVGVEAYANDPTYQAGLSVETDLFEFSVIMGRAEIAQLVDDLEAALAEEGETDA